VVAATPHAPGQGELPLSIRVLLDSIGALFLALAVALRPILPGHRPEANLWVTMCVGVAALAWLLRSAMERRLRLARTGLGLPLGLLLALGLVSVFRSPRPLASVATLLEWCTYALLFVVVVNFRREGLVGSGAVLSLLWASAFAVVLYGLFQQFVNLPLLRAQIEADQARTLLELRMSPRHLGDLMARASGRIFSTFLLSNSFAGFLALVFPGFLGHVLDRLRAGERGKVFLVVAGLWLAAALACLVLTYSKGGWAAFVFGTVLFCLALGRDLLRRYRRVVLGALGGGLALVVVLLAVGVIPFQIVRDAVPSMEVRLGYWRGALAMARDYPLGGVGLGTFGVHFPAYRPLLARPSQAAHNDYLQVLAELGVPGLVAFVWVWVACVRGVLRGLREGGAGQGTTRPWLFYLAGLLAFALSSMAMATFALAGWWDTRPGLLDLKLWLDRGLTLGFALAWVVFFAVIWRTAREGPGELCRKGLACGLAAFLLHCAVDFDYQEPGVAFSAWVVVAAAVGVRSATERRLSQAAAFAVGAAAVSLVGLFQWTLVRANNSATERDVAAARVSEAARTRDPEQRERLVAEARRYYEAALRANPLDDELCLDYADFLFSTLLAPGGEPRLALSNPGDVETFRRGVDLYVRAARLNRRWAAPHSHLARLFAAAAAGNAEARAALRPFVERYTSVRPPSGPRLEWLPAVAEFEAALRFDPNSPALLLKAALALEAHGDTAAARERLARALELDGMLRRKNPGHQLCLTYEELPVAEALARRLGLKRGG